jgi:phosphoglycolate phosphatase
MSMKALVLFDIDNTLTSGLESHFRAFAAGIKEIYGMEADFKPDDFSGMTDQKILYILLERKGLKREEIEEKIGECMRVMSRVYKENVANENIRLLDGSRELVETLNSDNVVLGIVSGNVEAIAWQKLMKVDLCDPFRFGGFGSDAIERSAVVRAALERSERLGFRFDKSRIFIIGDTVHDIKAAKDNGLQAIGVSTGTYSKRDLKSAGADHVFGNLKDTGKITEIITG